MKIAVCMKQVPAYSEGNMDEKTGLIIRAGLAATVNIYDMSALECALQIRDQAGGEVTVFTMGPPKAEAVIKEALACGADRGYLVSDKSFGGADVLATSYTLAQAIQSVDTFDLIICGKQTTDGDTSQVSGAIAKWMDIPHLTGVSKLLEFCEKDLKVQISFEEFYMTQVIEMPCLLAVERNIFTPRMPALKRKMAVRKLEIPMITLQDLEDCNPENYGLAGSATKVKKVFPPERTKCQPVVKCNGEIGAEKIKDVLESLGIGHQE